MHLGVLHSNLAPHLQTKAWTLVSTSLVVVLDMQCSHGRKEAALLFRQGA